MTNILFLFLCLVVQVRESDWVLKKESGDIIIYTRSVNGSSFDEFNGITVIPDCSLTDVLEVILDVKNYDRLYPDCANPTVLKQEGNYYDIHRIEAIAPWPVSDRDVIYEMETVISDNGKKARVTLKPLPNFIPESDDFLRIQKGTGFWELEENADRTIKVTYQFHGEPGGSIPAWLANSFVVEHPFKTLQNLKSRVKSGK